MSGVKNNQDRFSGNQMLQEKKNSESGEVARENIPNETRKKNVLLYFVLFHFDGETVSSRLASNSLIDSKSLGWRWLCWGKGRKIFEEIIMEIFPNLK